MIKTILRKIKIKKEDREFKQFYKEYNKLSLDKKYKFYKSLVFSNNVEIISQIKSVKPVNGVININKIIREIAKNKEQREFMKVIFKKLEEK